MQIDSIMQFKPGMLVQLCKDPLGYWTWPVEVDTIEAVVIQGAHTLPHIPNREFVELLWGEEPWLLSIAGSVRGRTNWTFTHANSLGGDKFWIYAVKQLA